MVLMQAGHDYINTNEMKNNTGRKHLCKSVAYVTRNQQGIDGECNRIIKSQIFKDKTFCYEAVEGAL